jgi:CubicO group peptidase (beta-lactamase class C family)
MVGEIISGLYRITFSLKGPIFTEAKNPAELFTGGIMTSLNNRDPVNVSAVWWIQVPSFRQAGHEHLIVSGLLICLLIIQLFFGSASASPAPFSTALSNSSSSSSGPIDEKELAAFMDGIVSAQIKAYHIPGATVAVVKDGRIFFTSGYGYADFRVGSVSKLFIWTAVMQLVEQGKLDLDADVNTYLKDLQIPATFERPITLKNLMSHTSGFEDLATGGRLFVQNASDIIPQEEYLKERMPARVRPPEAVTAYSNYGSSLAGYIVE